MTREELINKCDRGIFRVNRMYLRSRNESGYWLYRFLRPILKTRYAIFRRLHKPAPWLSPTSILFLNKYLTKDMIGAEFGSGSSTLFLASRISKLYSVEHNKDWYDLIQEKLKLFNYSNVIIDLLRKTTKQILLKIHSNWNSQMILTLGEIM